MTVHRAMRFSDLGYSLATPLDACPLTSNDSNPGFEVIERYGDIRAKAANSIWTRLLRTYLE